MDGLRLKAVSGHGNQQSIDEIKQELRSAIEHIERLNNSDSTFKDADHKKRMREYGTSILEGKTIDDINIETLRDEHPNKEWFIVFLRDMTSISTGGRRKHRTRRNKKQRKQRKHRSRKH